MKTTHSLTKTKGLKLVLFALLSGLFAHPTAQAEFTVTEVNATSFMGKLQAKIGLTMDLPTESQWEYACRADTTTVLNSCKNLLSTESDANMAEVGRYYYNHPEGDSSSSGVSTDGGTAKVGSYLPNAFGLYEMHGIVWEWCPDWSGTCPGTVTDPAVATSSSYRVQRGGSWNYRAQYCRSANRNNNPLNLNNIIGLRACSACPAQRSERMYPLNRMVSGRRCGAAA